MRKRDNGHGDLAVVMVLVLIGAAIASLPFGLLAFAAGLSLS